MFQTTNQYYVTIVKKSLKLGKSMVFCAHLCPFHTELMVKGPNILKLHPLGNIFRVAVANIHILKNLIQHINIMYL